MLGTINSNLPFCSACNKRFKIKYEEWSADETFQYYVDCGCPDTREILASKIFKKRDFGVDFKNEIEIKERAIFDLRRKVERTARVLKGSVAVFEYDE